MTEPTGRPREDQHQSAGETTPADATPRRTTQMLSASETEWSRAKREIEAGVASDDWNRAEMERASEPHVPIVKERLFSPAVLILWALFTLVAYFGIKAAGTALKVTVASSRAASKPGPDGNVTIVLPNGKRITIKSDNPHGPKVTVTDAQPAATAPVPEPATPTPAKPPAPKTAPAPAPTTKR